MLKDSYILKGAIAHERKGINQNVRTFLELFNAFYDRIRQNKYPNFFPEMRDPYGFALMCKDYKNDNLIYDMDLTCKEIFEGKGEENHIDYITYRGQFSFVEILDFLYRGFWFDYEKALYIYDNQHDALDVFTQIIEGRGFIYNRAKPQLSHSRKYYTYAMESLVNLNENKPIQVPHIWRLCDGMVPPFIVMKHFRDIKVQKAECHGFGDGIFLIANNEIIDVLKINDTWFTDLPLETRLKYGVKCTEYDVAQYGKAWSWRSILDVGKMMGANATNGLLVRSSREDFFKNRWFNWSKTSLVYCFKNKEELVANKRGFSQPTFYTLEGDEGVINPIEERIKERVWLDNFDIKEFQKIKELGRGR